MKKLVLLAVSATAVLAISHKSYSEESGPYIQGSIYGTDMTDTKLKVFGVNSKYDSDIGLGAGAEFGYKFNKFVRVGAEAAYRHNDVQGNGAKGEFESGAAMGNLYIDIPTNTPVTPYVGAGAGYAYVTDTDLHDNVFAYQGMAGLSFAATPKSDIILGYKYFDTSTPRYDVAPGVKVAAPYKVHNVELGFRYKF